MNHKIPYIEAFQKLAGFRIKFKADSRFQRILAFLVQWYIPTYLTHYTTAIGKSIFFPSTMVLNSTSTKFIIAHEVVHLLDQKRLTTPLFLLIYLSPQIFAIGVLAFPWIGYDALWFLVFGLPWPSPGRVWLEARAYGLEMFLYQQCGYQIFPTRYIEIFQSPGYYFMSWNSRWSSRLLMKYFNAAKNRNDKVFNSIISTFNTCR